MPQYFDRRWNLPLRLVLFGAPALIVAAVAALALASRSPYMAGTRQPVEQPVPFSHAYHVGELELDCRYCHDTVEQSAFAGMPASGVCLDCHRRVWTGLGALAPLVASGSTEIPVAWRRIHDLPDYACFDHSIHVRKGFGCVTCHGRVDHMPVTWQAKSLSMNWCLDCHREPERYVRPRAYVFDMAWQRPTDPEALRAMSAEAGIEPPVASSRALGEALVAMYRIGHKTNCSDCHR
jgi:hypothetical protein